MISPEFLDIFARVLAVLVFLWLLVYVSSFAATQLRCVRRLLVRKDFPECSCDRSGHGDAS